MPTSQLCTLANTGLREAFPEGRDLFFLVTDLFFDSFAAVVHSFMESIIL